MWSAECGVSFHIPHSSSQIQQCSLPGVDIIEISRIRDVLDRYGQRFLDRVFTAGEIAYCRGRAPNLAARFAAKEAAMKALGTGVRGVGWERHRGGAGSQRRAGRPLPRPAESRARRLGVLETSLSISHSRDYAVAFVVVRREDPE